MWVFHQASGGPSQQAQPALGPQMLGGISLQSRSWEGVYVGHIGGLGPVCSVFMPTSQVLLNDLLLLCMWEVGPIGLGKMTRQWHGQQ